MIVPLDPPAYGTDAWLEWRRGGLGASDLPSIVGLSPWRGEYELALQKRGELVDDGNRATRWGQRIEALALDAYEELQGVELLRGETWGNAQYPHCWATLDGRHDKVGVEIKAYRRWGGVPAHVNVQVQAQMGLAELERVDVVRVTPYGEPEITTVDRDEAVIRDLLAYAEEWWSLYGTGDTLPPLDGSQAARRQLDRLRGDDEREATAEQEALVAALRIARRRAKEVDAEQDMIVRALKASMAGTGVLTGEGFRVTWSAVKAKTTVNWQGVANAFKSYALKATDAETLEALVGLHSAVSEPSTSFRPMWFEEESES